MAEKPGLALIIGEALAKKKGKVPPAEEDHEYSEEGEADARLQDISDDLLQAFEDKDSVGIKELLREAVECILAARS